VSDELDGIRAEVHVVREAGEAVMKSVPQKNSERNAAESED
jgi:hypothetical protein